MLPGVWAFDIMINDVILCHYCASPLLTCMVKLRDCYNLVISVSTEYCWATWTTPQTSAIYKLYWNLNVTGQFLYYIIYLLIHLLIFSISKLFNCSHLNCTTCSPNFPAPFHPFGVCTSVSGHGWKDTTLPIYSCPASSGTQPLHPSGSLPLLISWWSVWWLCRWVSGWLDRVYMCMRVCFCFECLSLQISVTQQSL